MTEAFKTFVAQVVEVSVDKDGKLKVERVVCAVDCGIPINPDVIAAQMEGGIGFGIGAILHSAITLKDGKVEQNNFDGYQVLRIAEMPKVEVHIVPSGEAPTGVGEPGVAPIGPALANAIFAATGQRLYNLPFPPPSPRPEQRRPPAAPRLPARRGRPSEDRRRPYGFPGVAPICLRSASGADFSVHSPA